MDTSSKIQRTDLLAHRRYSFGRTLLWGLMGLALLYAAWMVFDLFTHPFEAGANSGVGSPYLFRWLSFACGILTLVIALFILRRVPGNPVGPLLLLWGVGALVWSVRTEYVSPSHAAWSALILTLYFLCLALPAFVLLIYYFPTGKTHPQWLNRWIILLTILYGISGLLEIMGTPSNTQIPNLLYRPGFEFGPVINIIALFPLTIGAIVSLTLRYRRGTSQERLQLRWFIWLLAMVILFTLAGQIGIFEIWGNVLFRVIVFILWQSFPAVAIGVALLRHRLWDIDVIIRKTLVYGIVTGLLALVYFGSVVLLQELFQVITGQHQSPLATVSSTLGIVVLFTPLRRRVQDFIDRRFYRQKYDAEQTLQAFAAQARDEVDIERLSTALVSAVQETVQPEGVSVWLKNTPR